MPPGMIDTARRWLAGLGSRKGNHPVPSQSEPSLADLRAMVEGSGKAISASTLLSGTVDFSELSSYESMLRNASSKVWASWKCCDLVASRVSRTPWKLISERDIELERKAIPADLGRILSYPNERMTFEELLYLTVMHVKFTGNAYWYKSEALQDGSRPRNIYPIMPDRVRIVVDPNNGKIVGYAVSGIAGVNGQMQSITIPFDPEEIIHFKRPHPNHDFYGLGDIEAGATLVGEALNAQSAALNSWKNGAVPHGILTKETDYPTSEDEWRKLKARWNKEYGGPSNAGKIGWLGGKWSSIRLGLTPAEIERVESNRMSVEQLASLHGVPLSVLGIKDAANYATAEVDRTRFAEDTVAPAVEMIESTMDTDLISGWRLRIKFSVAGMVSVGGVLASIIPAFDRGVLSINEVRQMIGLEPDPSNPLWEAHYMSAGLTELGLAGVPTDNTRSAADDIVKRFTDRTLNPTKE